MKAIGVCRHFVRIHEYDRQTVKQNYESMYIYNAPRGKIGEGTEFREYTQKLVLN